MENLHIRLDDTKDVISNMSETNKLKTLNTCSEILTWWNLNKLDQSILLTTYDPNRASYWKIYWIESVDNNAALRAHYIIKIYILMKIMYPTLEEQLTWLNTIQTDFHCHSPLLLMMQENNGYLLLILESINQQLKQRARELSH